MTGTIFVELAGARLSLSAGAPDMTLALGRDTRPFLGAPGPTDIDLSVDWLAPELSRRVLDEAQLVFDSGHLWRLLRLGGEPWLSFASPRFGPQPYKLAHFSPAFDRGTVHLDRRCVRDGEVDPLEYPLDEVMWMHWLAQRRGIILHGCGLVDEDGRGYLFVGQSGAGKTTTARLWQSRRRVTVLSDDRIIVSEREGKLWMSGTPWHGEAGLAAAESAPVSGVFLLHQSSSSRLVELGAAAATGRLLAASFVPFHDPGALLASTQLVARLVASVDCRQLSFSADASAVEVVLLSGGAGAPFAARPGAPAAPTPSPRPAHPQPR